MLLNQDSITTFVLVATCFKLHKHLGKVILLLDNFPLTSCSFCLAKEGTRLWSNPIIIFQLFIHKFKFFRCIFPPSYKPTSLFLLSHQCTDILFIQLYTKLASIKFFEGLQGRLRYSSPIMELSYPVYSLNDKTNVL